MPIPSEIGDTWNFLHQEVVWLHGRWTMYTQLYGTNEARIDALNKVAPTFFAILQGILVDEVQLTLSRLGDPSRSGGRENLALETLTNRIDQLDIPHLAGELRRTLGKFRMACAAIVKRRNRRIAHSDLRTHLRVDSEGLEGPSRAEINAALVELRSFMQTVYQHFQNSLMAYDQFAMTDDANSVLRVVAEALRYRELQVRPSR